MISHTCNPLSFPPTVYPSFPLILKNDVSNMTPAMTKWRQTIYSVEKIEKEEYVHLKKKKVGTSKMWTEN